MTWSREDLAWLAGLFEGEGCISIRRHGERRYVCLALSSTDYDVITQAVEVAGVGAFALQRIRPGCKPIWRWQVSRAEHAAALLYALYPWLGTRRRARATEAITAWHDSCRVAQQQAAYRSTYCLHGHLKEGWDGKVMSCLVCRADQARRARRAG